MECKVNESLLLATWAPARRNRARGGREAAPAVTDFLFPSGLAPTPDAAAYLLVGRRRWACRMPGSGECWVVTGQKKHLSLRVSPDALQASSGGMQGAESTARDTGLHPTSALQPDSREQAEKHMEMQWRKISPMLAFGLCLRSHFIQFSRKCQWA